MWPTLMSCSFLLSCTSGPQDTGEFTLLPPNEVQFFEGTSAMMTPDGESMGKAGRLWLRRGLFPVEGQVIEDLISEDVQGQLAVYRVNIVVDGQDFSGSMEDASGTLDISGTLDGEDWNWTGWRSTGTYVEGQLVGYSIRSVAALSDSALNQDKRVYDADDVLLLKITEALSVVDVETWQTAMEEIGLDLSEIEDGLR